ncbi:hypothetical protein COCSADRAFT_352798 [Bipolaris sorokiniana ND90Pr]|uniref:Uncharacterized protein n=1 Tax=Cochliobolus sativus (strain ND90Pr / ATCC 201652) TaxID=665912 RepID=M2TGD6_COCSN|nr:uncharacterized protein COCSADRAFT_352798 [Bipolaris sorokiniana ND90Pr]EMD67792.1 hypothetical protein COCSADRAFT_352798 [Bipolaris sorokiniana ND90Pr]
MDYGPLAKSLGRWALTDSCCQPTASEVKGDALLTSYLWTADGPPKTLPSAGLAHAIKDQESQSHLSRLSDDTSNHASTVTPLPFPPGRPGLQEAQVCFQPTPVSTPTYETLFSDTLPLSPLVFLLTCSHAAMQPCSHADKHGVALVQASAIAMAHAQPSEGLYD